MHTLYIKNGLIFWTERQIQLRETAKSLIVTNIQTALRSQNKAFEFMQVEAPILTPQEYINPNYSASDYYSIDDLVLRPETTMGSYEYAKYLLTHTELKVKLPLCIWQHGKSFRREQDQATKYMRLKEFYQLEFQCIYGTTTVNDYSIKVIDSLKSVLEMLVGPCRIEDSDRLPSYSTKTVDIICQQADMEICSISLRNDFPNARVLEVAVGTDRIVKNCIDHKLHY
jgi:glycyl-tRNA synthetase